jgi:hypothetical protein
MTYDEHEDNTITGSGPYIRTTQGKWINQNSNAIFFVEGRKIKVDMVEGLYTLTDAFKSDEGAQMYLDRWIVEYNENKGPS